MPEFLFDPDDGGFYGPVTPAPSGPTFDADDVTMDSDTHTFDEN